MRIKIYFLMFSGTLGIPYKHRLLHVSPPASVPSQSSVSAWARPMPGEVTDRRIWTGGSSRGLSAARPLLSADWGCCRLRSSEPACTAPSSIKQVVRLSHNFIVHFSPAAGHGAGRNQQVSPGKRDKRHLEDGLTVAEEKVWRAHQLEFLAAQKCWGSMCVNACKLHTFTYMPAAMRNIQGRTDPKPDAWKASLWSWSNPTPANTKLSSQVHNLPTVFIPAHHQFWLSREERGKGPTGEMGSGGDVWGSILCSFLSPPMQTTRRDGVQIRGRTPELRVAEALLWKTLGLCTRMSEGEVPHFPPTSPPDFPSRFSSFGWCWMGNVFPISQAKHTE